MPPGLPYTAPPVCVGRALPVVAVVVEEGGGGSSVCVVDAVVEDAVDESVRTSPVVTADAVVEADESGSPACVVDTVVEGTVTDALVSPGSTPLVEVVAADAAVEVSVSKTAEVVVDSALGGWPLPVVVVATVVDVAVVAVPGCSSSLAVEVVAVVVSVCPRVPADVEVAAVAVPGCSETLLVVEVVGADSVVAVTAPDTVKVEDEGGGGSSVWVLGVVAELGVTGEPVCSGTPEVVVANPLVC